MKALLAFLSALMLLGTAPATLTPEADLAARIVESRTGMIPEILPGSLPAELDKRVPLPAAAKLVGSLVLTPIQYFGDHGSTGLVDLFYDMGSPQVAQDYAGVLGRDGWRVKSSGAPAATLYCKPGAPSIMVTATPNLSPPRNKRLLITLYRTHPGVDPCK